MPRQLNEVEYDLIKEGWALRDLCVAYVSRLHEHDKPIEDPGHARADNPVLAFDHAMIDAGRITILQGFAEVIRGITNTRE